MNDLSFIAVVVGLFFLFIGEPDVFDALRNKAMSNCVPVISQQKANGETHE